MGSRRQFYCVRKVRAPQSGITANSRRGRPQGKCNRDIPPAVQVRVERRGKSSPACGEPRGPANPIRSNIDRGVFYTALARRYPEGWLKPCSNVRRRKMIALNDRTRLTVPLKFCFKQALWKKNIFRELRYPLFFRMISTATPCWNLKPATVIFLMPSALCHLL